MQRLIFNSDEPQHLHVAWAWAHGMVQYRDVFDNHAPLFHLISAPLLRLFGENPYTLIEMRILMIPLYLVTLVSVFLIASSVSDRKTGGWAALLTALMPLTFVASIQYRTDNLWAALWLAALAVLWCGKHGKWRMFAAGLLLGAALCVSLKTVALLLGFGLGSLISFIVLRRRGWTGDPLLTAQLGAFLGAGMSLPIITLLALFAKLGALGPLLYGTIQHNTFSGVSQMRHDPRVGWFLFVCALGATYVAADRLTRTRAASEINAPRLLLILTTVCCSLVLGLLWPVFPAQDYLPLMPLVCIVAALLLFGWLPGTGLRPAERSSERRPWGTITASALALAFGFLNLRAWPKRDETRRELGFIRHVLRLTNPDDTVMDWKGESIFRNRAFFYVLETLTLERLRRGLLSDTIPESIIRNRTCVATANLGRLPPRGRTFIACNFLRVGDLRVAGKELPPLSPAAETTFEIAIPARYVLLTRSGSFSGKLDGRTYEGSVFLGPGVHRIRGDATGVVRVVWAQAVERGFTPTWPPVG